MIIGITGGIGTGKSTVKSMFEKLGFPCIDADDIILELYKPGSQVFKQILLEAGNSVLSNDCIDRNKLRPIKLSNATNTLIQESIWQEVILCSKPKYPTLFFCARIFEEAFPVNKVCTIFCPLELQKIRALERGVPSNILEKILEKQLTTEAKLVQSDFTLDNSTDIITLKASVVQCSELLLNCQLNPTNGT